jgi:hypothetical protein
MCPIFLCSLCSLCFNLWILITPVISSNYSYICIHGKRNDFNCASIRYQHLGSYLPTTPSYEVYISKLMHYTRACSLYQDRAIFIAKLITQLYDDGWYFMSTLIPQLYDEDWYLKATLITQLYDEGWHFKTTLITQLYNEAWHFKTTRITQLYDEGLYFTVENNHTTPLCHQEW